MNATRLSVFNYSIQNAANDSLDIFIDGDIVDAETQEMYRYWLGEDTSVSYKSFRTQVLTSEAKTFNVYINSGGGLVTDAMAMHDLLIDLQEKGKVVNTIGRGIIASAATYILMAGKNATMSSNSWLMIHNVSGMAWGSINEMENYVRTMRQFNDASIKFYQDKTGLSEKEIGKMMDKETWMTASEAKDNGFIKNVSGEANFTNTIKPEQWQFQNKAVLNSYNSFIKNQEQMDYSKITEAINNAFAPMLEKFGISNKKDDVAIQEAIAEFSGTITNVIKENVPTAETITNQVNEAVTNALANIGENEAFKNAVAANIAVGLTTEDVQKVVNKGLENAVTKDDLVTNKTEILTAVVEKMGGQTQQKETAVITNRKAGKFAGVTWDAE